MAALVASLFCLPGCLQPGSIEDDPGAPRADAAPGAEEPDAEPGDPNPNPGQPDADTPAGLTFTADIYPKIQTLGCIGCHQGPSAPAGLIMNDGAANVYPRLMSGRVNTVTPESSLVLIKPLVGSPASTHPFKPFTSTSDANYQLILSWIEGGAAQ